MTPRKLFTKIHLWLGLTTGIVVFIVSITGCIYVFEKEIRNFTEPFQQVTPQNRPLLLPSVLKGHALGYLNNQFTPTDLPAILGIQYGASDKAAIAAYIHPQSGYTMLYLNPYTGEVLKERILSRDILRIVIHGHYSLWLPYHIGKPVVAWSVLLFVMILITGLLLWIPKKITKQSLRRSLTIQWKAPWRRLNFDLHNVLGFYGLVFGLILSITGLVWGFDWFNKGYYYALSGGKSFPGYQQPLSDTTLISSAHPLPSEDRLWLKEFNHYASRLGSLRISFPQKPAEAISLTFNPSQETYYRQETHYFDRHSLRELKGSDIYAQPYNKASYGEKLYRMNYDIHTGAILGLPGKILAFFASLICASLPITGFIIWSNKRKKRKPESAR